MKQLQHGILIAIEGIDGCGKSTLTQELGCELCDYPVITTREPGATDIGQAIGQLLVGDYQKTPETEFLLFAADRSEHMQRIVLPALAEQKIVISDRMADSSVAYQGYGRGVSIEKITMINDWVMKGREPDLILYLALGAETAWERIAARKKSLTTFEREKKIFFERVIQGFEEALSKKPHAKRIDASQPIEIVREQALAAIEQLIGKYVQ